MKNKTLLIIIIVVLISIAAWALLNKNNKTISGADQTNQQEDSALDLENKPQTLSIENLRKGVYHGSVITIEQTLDSGSNYSRYIASYKSEGLKIYALLTIPNGEKPETGWPVIIFNHGYIPPAQYRTTERYIAYTDVFSRN